MSRDRRQILHNLRGISGISMYLLDQQILRKFSFSGVPRPKRLGIGSERAFSTSRVLSAGSVEVWTARRAGAKRGRILEDSGRHA